MLDNSNYIESYFNPKDMYINDKLEFKNNFNSIVYLSINEIMAIITKDYYINIIDLKLSVKDFYIKTSINLLNNIQNNINEIKYNVKKTHTSTQCLSKKKSSYYVYCKEEDNFQIKQIYLFEKDYGCIYILILLNNNIILLYCYNLIENLFEEDNRLHFINYLESYKFDNINFDLNSIHNYVFKIVNLNTVNNSKHFNLNDYYNEKTVLFGLKLNHNLFQLNLSYKENSTTCKHIKYLLCLNNINKIDYNLNIKKSISLNKVYKTNIFTISSKYMLLLNVNEDNELELSLVDHDTSRIYNDSCIIKLPFNSVVNNIKLIETNYTKNKYLIFISSINRIYTYILDIDFNKNNILYIDINKSIRFERLEFVNNFKVYYINNNNCYNIECFDNLNNISNCIIYIKQNSNVASNLIIENEAIKYNKLKSFKKCIKVINFKSYTNCCFIVGYSEDFEEKKNKIIISVIINNFGNIDNLSSYVMNFHNNECISESIAITNIVSLCKEMNLICLYNNSFDSSVYCNSNINSTLFDKYFIDLNNIFIEVFSLINQIYNIDMDSFNYCILDNIVDNYKDM